MNTNKKEIRHPAKFSDALFPQMAEMLDECNCGKVLDPFAGTGKIGLIKTFGFNGTIYANELEPEWLEDNKYDCDYLTFQDAEKISYPKEYFDAICTSPTYGNRMADCHNAKDGSKRITYTHCLGRNLNNENTGKMQFGSNYKNKHIKIYKHLFDVLKDGGCFILNIKNHIRGGKEIDVVDFHKSAMEEAGFIEEQDIKIEVPCMGFGQNRNARVPYEHLIKFRKPIVERS